MKDAIVEFGVRKTAGKKAGREKNPASFFYLSQPSNLNPAVGR